MHWDSYDIKYRYNHKCWWGYGETRSHISEKAMAPHSSTLAWKIPRAEEPGRLQSLGSRRVGHDWSTSLSLFTFMHWRRKWQPTPVFFLPGESQGRGSLVGCRLWGRTELDMTEVTQQHRDFLSGPVFKILPSSAWGMGLIPGRGAKVPNSVGYSQKL